MAERFWNRIALQPQALNPRLRSRVRRSFFAYAGLLLVIGWAYALWYLYEDRSRTVAFAGEQLRAIADSLVVQMEATVGDGLGSAESTLTDLRNSGRFDELPTDVIAGELREEVTGNYIRALFVGNPDRTIAAGKGGIMDESRGAPAWLPQPPEGGQTIVAPPMRDPLRAGHTVIPIARGVTGGPQEPAWVGMWFDVGELLDRYQTIGIDRGTISILSSDGWLLAGTSLPGRPPPKYTDLGTTELFGRVQALPPGSAQVLEGISDLDGRRKLFSVAKVGANVPLFLVVSRQYQAIIAPWRRNTATVLRFSAGSSVLLIVMTVLLYRSLHEINRRESQFLKLFENSLASILLLKDGHVVEKNGQARRTFRVPDNQTLRGRSVEEISADFQEDGTPSAQAIAKYEGELKREGGALFQWRFKRTDTGEPFEAEVNISTIQVADDVVTLAMVRDISEQESTKRELRKANLLLEARVAQRTAALQRANAQLSATNRALEDFTASASHDLRSPLSAISGQAGLLELTLGDQLGAREKERLTRIQRAVKRASDVVGGLLSLARITRQELREESVSLSDIAQSVVEELRETDPQREIEIFIQPDMRVCADPGLMTSLVGNLIGNAWKYSRKRPLVWIRFERMDSNGEHVYCVADRGAGFSMEHAAKLFQAFRRLHPEEEFGGVGLGLATVQRIVTRYGGTIWAEAEANAGAKFFFTLPNAQECEGADAPTDRPIVDVSPEEAPVRQGEYKTGTPTLRLSRG